MPQCCHLYHMDPDELVERVKTETAVVVVLTDGEGELSPDLKEVVCTLSCRFTEAVFAQVNFREDPGKVREVFPGAGFANFPEVHICRLLGNRGRTISLTHSGTQELDRADVVEAVTTAMSYVS